MWGSSDVRKPESSEGGQEEEGQEEGRRSVAEPIEARPPVALKRAEDKLLRADCGRETKESRLLLRSS